MTTPGKLIWMIFLASLLKSNGQSTWNIQQYNQLLEIAEPSALLIYLE